MRLDKNLLASQTELDNKIKISLVKNEEKSNDNILKKSDVPSKEEPVYKKLENEFTMQSSGMNIGVAANTNLNPPNFYGMSPYMNQMQIPPHGQMGMPNIAQPYLPNLAMQSHGQYQPYALIFVYSYNWL